MVEQGAGVAGNRAGSHKAGHCHLRPEEGGGAPILLFSVHHSHGELREREGERERERGGGRVSEVEYIWKHQKIAHAAYTDTMHVRVIHAHVSLSLSLSFIHSFIY